MQLSIIIVNYNVKFFLEQCLCSVQKAIKKISSEVLVVDNASKDGSTEYLKPLFPSVQFICLKENVGFAKANNAALKFCKGKYVLYLNPDTIVPEDCLEKCIDFIEGNVDAGAIGVRMIDGRGNFLPESKRSFPSPLTSLFKLAGLAALFPKSRLFGRYALGYLDEHQTHEVDVLAGAFLMARRDILANLGGFDESFFMYGEDIDLSYRIQKSGYRNYYFAGSTIIHFKGESTKKGSLNYVRMFYQAMSIFVQKHYASGKARLFSSLIHVAIFFRAVLATIISFVGKLRLPLLDIVLILGSFKLVTNLWIKYVRGGRGFIEELVNVSLPGFTLVFLAAATLAGMYDNKYNPLKALFSALAGILVMLAVYSLLPERFRFSRGVILFGGLSALLFITLSRALLSHLNWLAYDDETSRHQQSLVVGTQDDYEQVLELLEKAGLHQRVLGRISVNGGKENSVGTLNDLNTIIDSISVKEVIFCEGFLSYNFIIQTLQKLPRGIIAHFHGRNTLSIVGSDSKDTSGEFVTVEEAYNLSLPYQRRMKRIVDIAVSFVIILSFPVHIIINGFSILRNAFFVLVGKKTWIGYSTSQKKLPHLAVGVLSTTGLSVHDSTALNKESLLLIDQWYAKEYHWMHDVKLIIRHYRNL